MARPTSAPRDRAAFTAGAQRVALIGRNAGAVIVDGEQQGIAARRCGNVMRRGPIAGRCRAGCPSPRRNPQVHAPLTSPGRLLRESISSARGRRRIRASRRSVAAAASVVLPPAAGSRRGCGRRTAGARRGHHLPDLVVQPGGGVRLAGGFQSSRFGGDDRKRGLQPVAPITGALAGAAQRLPAGRSAC